MPNDFEIYGITILAALGILPVIPPILLALPLFRPEKTVPRRKLWRRFFVVSGASVLLYSVVIVDAFVLEPNWPVLTRLELEGNVSQPLQILHLSDFHIENGFPRRERWFLRMLQGLSPDLIIFTGDMHQLGNKNVRSVARVLAPLRASLGIYACFGYDRERVITDANPNVTFLLNQGVLLRRGDDTIGVGNVLGPERATERVCSFLSSADYRIVMSHTPGYADEAANRSVDLYLCGHTHGGQVRIPFWGAIATNPSTGKRYEAGHYQRGNMHIYTSRGLGLEPPPAPQVRFLCRPEITLITVRPITK